MPVSMTEVDGKKVKFVVRDKEINGVADPEPRELLFDLDDLGSLSVVTLSELANPESGNDEQIWYEIFTTGGVQLAFRFVQDLGYSIFENLYGNHKIDGPYKVE